MKLFTVSAEMVVTEGVGSGLIKVPFGDGMMKLLTGVEGGITIKTADVVVLKDETKRVVREGCKERMRWALAYVACPSGCQLRLMSNTIDESIEHGAVTRAPRPIEAAAGVEVVHQDEFGALIVMMPRASFRLSYDGRRPAGVPPQAVVLWSGRYDANRPCAGLNAYARTNRL